MDYNKFKIIIKIFFLLFAVLLISPAKESFAAVTSVTLTPIDSPTTLSNGLAYYLPGKYYRFRVQAVDPTATIKDDWDNINIVFNGGSASITIAVSSLGDSISAQTNLTVVNPATQIVNNTAIYSNLDYTIYVTFLWSCPALTGTTSKLIRATVTNDFSGTSLSDNRNVTYGFINTVKVANFAKTLEALDSRVNPQHGAFDVTGSIVYAEPAGDAATGTTDLVNSYANLGLGEVTGMLLLQNGINSACGYVGNSSGFTFNVPASHFNTFGDYRLTIQCNMATAGGPKITSNANSTPLNVNRVRMDNVQFYNGGGIGSMAAPYYRSVLVAGTRVRITASLENGGSVLLGDADASMKGNTSFAVYWGTTDAGPWSGPLVVPVTINAGATTGDANIDIPVVPDQGTTLLVYRVRQVYGGAYDSEPVSDTLTHTPTAAGRTISWDRNDPPNNPYVHGAGVFSTPFTPFSVIALAGALQFTWTPFACPDFYSYRVYYKLSSSPTWILVDRSTVGYGALQFPATGTVTINGLVPASNYDYMISAIDIFGNEVALANRFSSGVPIVTQSSVVSATMTDGVDVYNNAHFAGAPAATNRQMRLSAIKVSFYITTTGAVPESVNIIVDDTGNGNILLAGPVVNGTAHIYSCTKTAPNTYTGFIPTTDIYMTMTNELQFICQAYYSGVPSYSGFNTGADPNTCTYAFQINKAPKVTPWPVRILNNVINDKNPVAYPSYYLTDDARVTIKVYDVRGRIVKTLLENARRPGGQNIKEGGWDGRNKAGNKCGVGLYYVYIKAKRLSDGKTVIDEFRKVVIAR